MKRHFTRLAALTLVLCIASLASPPLLADDAPAVFKARCAACHAADGSGDTVMGKKLNVKPLGSADVQKQTDKELQSVITGGRGKMPGFGKKLTAEQAANLVKLVRGFAAK